MLTVGMTDEQLDVLRSKLLCDYGYFVRFFFKALNGKRFLFADHVSTIVREMEMIAAQEITRDIINIPPRYGKTEVCVKMFMAWSLANNPRARFMHISFSDSLALDNSSVTKSIVKSEDFQRLFPECRISNKTDSVNKWYTTSGGGVYAVSSGGQITGFGAGIFGEREYSGSGSPADGFGGCIIVDDPLKPDDADSETKRTFINRRVNTTFMSRLNSEKTPFVVIMQRIHDDDMAGFLLGGGSGEEWHNLKLPAIRDDGTPLFPQKHTVDDLEKRRKANPRVFAAQYMQSPVVDSGNIFKREWFRYYDDKSVPTYFDREFQSWDCTFKDTVNADFVCGQLWGIKGPEWYLLDMVHARMSFTDTVSAMMEFSRKHPEAVAKYIEEKANGAAIIDVLSGKVNGLVPVCPHESKIARAHAVTACFQAGNVHFPKDAEWLAAFEDELTKFPSVRHDDMVDATTQAISQTMQQTDIWSLMD